MEIPADFQKTVTTMYYLWMGESPGNLGADLGKRWKNECPVLLLWGNWDEQVVLGIVGAWLRLLSAVLPLSQHHCSLPELPILARLVLRGPLVWFWVWPLHPLGSALHALFLCLLVSTHVQSFQVCP